MLSSSAWRPFPRYMAEPEPVEEIEEVTLYEHDLILRYAIVGIFVILATASLALTKAVAMPIMAGVICGLVLGPLVDWLVRHGAPQHAASALVVVLFIGLMLGAIAILAVPVAGWSDQAPAMMAALQTKLAGVFAFMDEFKRGIASITGKGAELSVSQGNPLFDIAMSSSTAAGGMLVFFATVYFWLATRRHLKARVLRLCLGRGGRRGCRGRGAAGRSARQAPDQCAGRHPHPQCRGHRRDRDGAAACRWRRHGQDGERRP